MLNEALSAIKLGAIIVPLALILADAVMFPVNVWRSVPALPKTVFPFTVNPSPPTSRLEVGPSIVTEADLNTVSKSVRREEYTLFGLVVWTKTLGAPTPVLPPLAADALRK